MCQTRVFMYHLYIYLSWRQPDKMKTSVALIKLQKYTSCTKRSNHRFRCGWIWNFQLIIPSVSLCKHKKKRRSCWWCAKKMRQLIKEIIQTLPYRVLSWCLSLPLNWLIASESEWRWRLSLFSYRRQFTHILLSVN